MNIIRPALASDLPDIHQMQDIEFRDKVFIEPLPSCEEFVMETQDRIDLGRERLYVFEVDGKVSGFVRLLFKGREWEALTWGKWINTLAYASCVLAFERPESDIPKLVFAVRLDNKRVIHLYQKFNFRRTGQELVFYRPHLFSALKTTSLNYYELTREEYLGEKADFMRKNAMQLEFH
jgi:RimJ/RimL family protein N-acetyltransferase